MGMGRGRSARGATYKTALRMSLTPASIKAQQDSSAPPAVIHSYGGQISPYPVKQYVGGPDILDDELSQISDAKSAGGSVSGGGLSGIQGDIEALGSQSGIRLFILLAILAVALK